MTRVITYGTYDLLHQGHIRLLERAKALGTYLVVGVTSDDFDRARGKINVKQTLMERVEAIRNTGLADEIIIEEYQGQKIDDIRRLGIDIFTVGSDWEGQFDYLKEYCRVVYLERTNGISSSEIRARDICIRIGIIGQSHVIEKFRRESRYVNGLTIARILGEDEADFFDNINAVYVVSHPTEHYNDVKKSLNMGKHVLCESPIAMTGDEVEELCALAREKNLVLADGIKTAYSMAYSRLIVLAKSGIIGQIVSVDTTCTSLRDIDYTDVSAVSKEWSSLCSWGPTALLPVFDLLGTNWEDINIFSRIVDHKYQYDEFSKISLQYSDAVSSSKVGKGVKSEGELIISGTKGYIYVPAPWWKTEYFEVRYENPADNRRYFYQLEGEGIRYELVSFLRMIEGYDVNRISCDVSRAIATVIEHGKM